MSGLPFEHYIHFGDDSPYSTTLFFSINRAPHGTDTHIFPLKPPYNCDKSHIVGQTQIISLVESLYIYIYYIYIYIILYILYIYNILYSILYI